MRKRLRHQIRTANIQATRLTTNPPSTHAQSTLKPSPECTKLLKRHPFLPCLGRNSPQPQNEPINRRLIFRPRRRSRPAAMGHASALASSNPWSRSAPPRLHLLKLRRQRLVDRTQRPAMGIQMLHVLPIPQASRLRPRGRDNRGRHHRLSLTLSTTVDKVRTLSPIGDKVPHRIGG
jgi:hypothetical protein